MIQDEVIANPIHDDNAIYVYDAESVEVLEELEESPEGSIEEILIVEVIPEENIVERLKRKCSFKKCLENSCLCFSLSVVCLLFYFFSGGFYIVLAIDSGDDSS
jgi:hypothetical protein